MTLMQRALLLRKASRSAAQRNATLASELRSALDQHKLCLDRTPRYHEHVDDVIVYGMPPDMDPLFSYSIVVSPPTRSAGGGADVTLPSLPSDIGLPLPCSEQRAAS